MYSKDWIEGTAELMPDEKGVYIDLLCHQHQKKSLPNDTKRLARIVGLSHDEFLKIWETIGLKFNQVDDRLVNQRLNREVQQNNDRSLKNKIHGTIPRILDKYELKKVEKKEVYEIVYKSINYEDFRNKDDEFIKHSLNQLVDHVVNQVVDYIETETEDETEDKTEVVLPWDDERFLQVWEFWKQYKKEQFRFTYKQIGEQGALSKLKELSGGKLETAMLIIKQSIQNGWAGLFELKGEFKNKQYDEEFIFGNL